MQSRVVAHAPPAYQRQQGLTCGETNARTAIEAFRIPYRPVDRPRWRIRAFGYAFVRDIEDLLGAHGLSARIATARGMTAEGRLSLLMAHIDRDEPVIVPIGNGHMSRDRYVPWMRFLVGHFVTVYGYDREHEVFFVYDSYLAGEPATQIPIGNETRSFADFDRDWSGPFYYRFIGMKRTYIPIDAG